MFDILPPTIATAQVSPTIIIFVVSPTKVLNDLIKVEIEARASRLKVDLNGIKASIKIFKVEANSFHLNGKPRLRLRMLNYSTTVHMIVLVFSVLCVISLLTVK